MLSKILNNCGVVESISGFIYRINSDQNFKIFSGSEELTGYSLKELSSNKEGLASIIHPDDIELFFRDCSEAAVEKGCSILEYRIITKGGEHKWVEDRRTALFSENNHFLGVQGIVFDISERKHQENILLESEGKYRNLVEYSSDFIWEVNADGVYTYVSPPVEKILGYKPDEVAGKTPFDLMPSEESDRIRNCFMEVINRRGNLIRLENVNLHKDGHLVTLETSGVPVFNEEGEIVYYRGVDRDITERKRVEKENEEHIKELKDALENVKILSGLLPICSNCKKIRDDKGYWNQIEAYLDTHADVKFTHGICPDCIKKLYPEFDISES